MPTFALDPEGYTTAHGWRPLKKGQAGWDVFDLQCKLNYVHNGEPLAKDGLFGAITKANVSAYQSKFPALIVDGIAGVGTQVHLGLNACTRSELPDRVKGQMQQESSCLCGIYTPVYTSGDAKGFQDTGPIQRNTKYHPKLEENFDVAPSLTLLVATIKRQHTKYVNWGTADKRAWEAAQGYWNSPAQADRYAKWQVVTTAFLDYIDAVTTFVE